MEKQKSINRTIESIRAIEDQIKYFEDNKPLFFQKKKLQKYIDQIDKLEEIKNGLYKILEYKIDNNLSR